jgi:hypothetical protein
MPLQSGAQWDGLGHVFYENTMWNGYDCREVTSAGANKCGIEKTKNRMVGRGVFLDVARVLQTEALDDGYAITGEDLERTAAAHGVRVKRGDFVIVRTGQMEAKLAAGSWDGYPGGDAPGFSFETLDWIHHHEIAAIASDTWGCEVRPNESEAGINQPWHWITIPIMGLTMGEIFFVADLASDCAADNVYEFLFVAPAIPLPAPSVRRPIHWRLSKGGLRTTAGAFGHHLPTPAGISSIVQAGGGPWFGTRQGRFAIKRPLEGLAAENCERGVGAF